MASVLAIGEREIGKRYAGPVIGEPDSYRWGNPGYDCSSFVATVYREGYAISLPAFTDAIYPLTVPVSDPQPGDLVFYAYADPAQPAVRYPHMGLWVDQSTVLDARWPDGVGYHPHVRRGTIEVRRLPQLDDRPQAGNTEPEPGSTTNAGGLLLFVVLVLGALWLTS